MTENPEYLKEQIITYIGNKRALLGFIGQALEKVKTRLNKDKLNVLDLFAGSGIVSRYLKGHTNELYVNDLEPYSEVINSCYLTNKSEIDLKELNEILDNLKQNLMFQKNPDVFTRYYAPEDDNNIKEGERAFYTKRNALYLDTAKYLISEIDNKLQKFFFAPLLYEMSVHVNTSGVFKGFYKNKQGIGQFGGEGRNALKRITGDIELKLPIFSNFENKSIVTRLESEKAIENLPELDLAYLDPPYNQHPYGSNYFMLNLLIEKQHPLKYSKVSGIPTEWNRSDYNKKEKAKEKLFRVVENLNSKFILISYNSEGFIKKEEFVNYLNTLGKVEQLETNYNTFRGSRNLRNRDIKVKEYLYLLEK